VTLATLKSQTLERLGEDPTKPSYYTTADVTAALNRAQRLFVLLTLCLENSTTLALTANTTYYSPRATITDWFLPLRATITAGTNPKIRPATVGELRARSATWEADIGAPTHYGSLGIDLLFFWPRPNAGGTSVDLTYAAQPTRMVADADTPDIPEAHHSVLMDYAIPWSRLKEGGQELAKAVRHHLPRFHAAAQQLGDYVRRRSLDLRYDTLPFELARYDASRLLELKVPKPRPQRTLEDSNA
jgi:hypothetical protein